MAIMNPQYAKYMAMAERYRKNRPELAAALERQAQKELEKPAMDVSDVAYAQGYKDANNGGYIGSQGWQEPTQQPVEEQPVAQQTAQPQQVVAPKEDTPWVKPPVVPQNPPAPHKPTAEELANMADSQQYNVGADERANMVDSQQYNKASDTYLPNMYDGDLGLDLSTNENSGGYNANDLADKWGATTNDGSTGSGIGGSFDDEKIKKDLETFKKLYPQYFMLNKEDFS